MSSSLAHRLCAEIARLEHRIVDERRRRIPNNSELSELKRRRLLLRGQLPERKTATFDRWRPTPAPFSKRLGL